MQHLLHHDALDHDIDIAGIVVDGPLRAQVRRNGGKLELDGGKQCFLKLAKTGPIVLSGDLYHYPEEITYNRIPSFDFDKEQTAKSRAMIQDFVKQNHAQLWIQHDYTSGIKRKIAPDFYE